MGLERLPNRAGRGEFVEQVETMSGQSVEAPHRGVPLRRFNALTLLRFNESARAISLHGLPPD